MGQSKRGVCFDCKNSDCTELIRISLPWATVPGWAFCSCGYGYIVGSSCDYVKIFDDKANVETRVDFEARILLSLNETISVESMLHGRVFRKEMRSEFLAEVAAQGAVTTDSIPLPLGVLEDQGIDLPEAYVIKIAATGIPPALRMISMHYATEIQNVIEEFEA